MHVRHLVAALFSAALISAPATKVMADGDALVGGIIGGVIGGVIVNEANKKKQRTTRRTYTKKPTVSSATRSQNRLTQTSLNYFGFPAGSPDGVLGRRSRSAMSQYQAYLGYPVTGQLTQYERDFLHTSYNRALAGGAATNIAIAQNPQGPRGLLVAYRDQLVAPAAPLPNTTIVVAPQAAAPVIAAPVTAPATAGLPNFMADTSDVSLASHCNKVSLVTNTNGGFVTLASMTDPQTVLSEQFCLARTYAIAQGEELAGRVKGFSVDQIAAQCEGLAPALKEHISSLSLKTHDQVISGVSSSVLASGMAPAQLAGTSKICLSVGYRTDNMDVALASSLLLVVLGEQVYAELLGHHINQGFGASRRDDLAMAWYSMGADAVSRGQPAVFAPGQPERSDLIRMAAQRLNGTNPALPQPVQAQAPVTALPLFNLEN
jgi:hypothetical protein